MRRDIDVWEKLWEILHEEPYVRAIVRGEGEETTRRLMNAIEVGRRLEDVPGIATNILSRRLQHLERAGVLVARPYSRRPPRVEYHLTSAGRELGDALRMLASWGARTGGGDDPRRHDVCGTEMDLRWHCHTCARDVPDRVQVMGIPAKVTKKEIEGR